MDTENKTAPGDMPKQRIANAVASHYEEQYRKARARFDASETKEAAQEVEKLLLELLREIIVGNHHRLSGNPTFARAMPEEEDGKRKDIDKMSLIDLCRVFDASSSALFEHDTKLNENDRYYMRLKRYAANRELLRSFRFEALPSLLHECAIGDKDNPTLRLGVQQALCCVVALMHAHVDGMVVGPHYHFLTNYNELREELDQIRASNRKLTGVETKFEYVYADENEERDQKTKEFTWLRRRGMLLNTDRTRNIALKVETFVRIISTLFEEFVGQLNSADREDPTANRIANRIVAKAGYTSGIRFGRSMRESFQQDRKSLKLIDRIDEWCDFDSDVGFGLLKLPISEEDRRKIAIGEHDDLQFPFNIHLQNNFVVHQRETEDVNLCSFVAGYIQGVLEKICERPVVVTHSPDECEQFVPEQEYCVFQVKIDSEKLARRKELANKRYGEGADGFEFTDLDREAFAPVEDKKFSDEVELTPNKMPR